MLYPFRSSRKVFPSNLMHIAFMFDVCIHNWAGGGCIADFRTGDRDPGFGESLLARPFIILLVGLETAMPLIALLLVQHRQKLVIHEVWRLILAGNPGAFGRTDCAVRLVGVVLVG